MDAQLSLGTAPAPLPRSEALARLGHLIGRDLRALAPLYGVTFERDGQRNKGWAGQVVERYLGLGPDVLQRPDFGDWELKVVPLFERQDGRLVPRETMAITMFTEDSLERLAFEESHLWDKLRRLIVVSRLYLGPDERRSRVFGATPVDLGLDADKELVDALRADYEEIRWAARTHGPAGLNGRIGRWVQPRPKGMGHGRGGHGFYARKALVARLLGVEADAGIEADDAAEGAD